MACTFYLGYGTFTLYLLIGTLILAMKPITLEALLKVELCELSSEEDVGMSCSPQTFRIVILHCLLVLGPRHPVLTYMEPYRSLALLTGSLGLVSILIALSTDFWFVAMGPSFTFHSGLWPKGVYNKVADYIRATQSLTILASLSVLVSVIFLVLSYIPLLSLPGHGRLISSVTAFAAGLFAMVAMVVYTSERWNQPHSPQVQTFFSWSFYLGWVSTVLLLCTGSLSLSAYCRASRPGYDTL